MKERPILFTGSNVRAILADRKIHTRRNVKPQPRDVGPNGGRLLGVVASSLGYGFDATYHLDNPHHIVCPYGAVGDRLNVKEDVWMWCEKRPNGLTKTGRQKWHYVPLRVAPIHYCVGHPQKPALFVSSPETGNEWLWRKKIGRFLPRWASRITLEITAVRVERLNEISESDAIAEGIWKLGASGWLNYQNCKCKDPCDCEQLDCIDAKQSFRSLWESIHGPGTFDARWVWVLEFKRV